MEIDVSLILQAFSTLLFALAMFILNGFKKAMDKVNDSVSNVKDSVADLNTNIATLIQKDLNKDKRLEEHHEELKRVNSEIFAVRQRVHDLASETATKAALNEERINQLVQSFNSGNKQCEI